MTGVGRVQSPAAGRPLVQDAVAVGVAILIFAGHLAYGANRPDLALGFAAAWFLTLALSLALDPDARHAVEQARLGAPAIAFALVLLQGALSLTPFGVGGAHPVWSYAPRAHAAVSIDPYATILELVKLLALAAAFLVGYVNGADDERSRTLLRAILLTGLAYSAWAFVDHVLSPGLLFGAVRPFEADRLSASFGSANTAATLFGALTLLNLVDLLRTFRASRPGGRFHVSHLQRMLPPLVRPVLALTLSATCLVETFSRAGLTATVGVGIVLLGVTTLWRARPSAISAPLVATTVIVLGLLVASAALNSDLLQTRFKSAGNDSLMRDQIFAAHWAAFQAAPWSGYGLGTFPRINGLIMNAGNVANLARLGATHNVYIQWLEEAGLLGAAAMFATVAILTGKLLLGAFRRRSMRGWILAIVAVLALFAVHGASDYALETPSMALFLSLLLGLGVGVSAAGRRGAGVARAAGD